MLRAAAACLCLLGAAAFAPPSARRGARISRTHYFSTIDAESESIEAPLPGSSAQREELLGFAERLDKQFGSFAEGGAVVVDDRRRRRRARDIAVVDDGPVPTSKGVVDPWAPFS
mmetsp:Transcript_11704/g.36094  ORF Transcript_11704/g.36094 Transcript_11704/m.36094 type:complete len:115 (-) Transcript_11704:37-381(-)